MDRFDRIYALHRELNGARVAISRETLQARLECSRATLKRIIQDLRDFLGAPIEYDRSANGYHYAKSGQRPYELPGLWFNASELYSLLAVQELLKNIQPGLLDVPLAPLRKRIEQLLCREPVGSGELTQRVRILKATARPVADRKFQLIAGALVHRKQLHMEYHDRSQNQITERFVSPQRLVHYRDNWYLDAWCHLRESLRTFSMDRIQNVNSLEDGAMELDGAYLDAHFTRTYGIFAGEPEHIAVLRFTAERARWVADELWHPDQEGVFLEDGRYELRIPYGDHRELMMDILKYGADVEVVSPVHLRQSVVAHLVSAIAQYEDHT